MTNFVYGQPIAFQKYYTDSITINPDNFELMQTGDHGYLTGDGPYLVKTDSLGQMIWFRQYNTAAFYSIDKTSDNGYVATGSPIIIKLDSNYAVSWKIKFIPSLLLSSTVFYAIRETKDHGFILGGDIYVNVNIYGNILIKTDSVGIVQWSKIYPVNTGSLGFLSIADDGGFLLCGRAWSVIDTTSNLTDIIIIKTDSSGNTQWSKQYNSTGSNMEAFHIITVSDGNFVITGLRNLGKFILKIDSVGTILWEKYYSDAGYGYANWIEETKDHDLIVTGFHDGPPVGLCTHLLKTDSMGNFLLGRFLGANNGAWGCCVKQTEDGGYALGSVGQNNNFNSIYLIKTDSLGHTNGCWETNSVMTVSNLNDTVVNVIVTDSNLNITTVPSTITPIGSGYEFTVCPPIVGMEETQIEKREIEIYPNPFTEGFKVSGLKFKVGEKTNIVIYDLMGEKVYEKELTSNKTEAEFNLSFLQQGVYFLNVKGNGIGYTRKIVKM